LLRGHLAWRIAKGNGSTWYGLSSEAIFCASLHTGLQHVVFLHGREEPAAVLFCLFPSPFREIGVQSHSGGLRFGFM